MISRRLLRIKALICLYAYNRRDDEDLSRAEKELIVSINKTYELYHYLLLLIIELADIAAEKIEQSLRKKIPTPEDLNPNRRFAGNRLVEQLRNNKELRKYCDVTGLSWAASPDLPKILYNSLTKWEDYKKYMSSDKSGYDEDKKFIIKTATIFFPASDDLSTALEEQSIYWNDDLEYTTAMIEKTLRRFRANAGPDSTLMPLYRNDDDEKFVKHLFRRAITSWDQGMEMIDRNTTNWEIERVAMVDKIIMLLAITEIIEFEEIPVKVTLNEYIEIAKFYCTAKSSNFVNGILDKIVKEMKKEGLFRKTGRGLIGETE